MQLRQHKPTRWTRPRNFPFFSLPHSLVIPASPHSYPWKRCWPKLLLSSQLNFSVSDVTCCQADVPQFLVYTADDAIQSYTIDSVNQFLAQRMNPNGCTPRMTYYTSLNYTNYTLVTDWFVAGNEIADHTLVTSISSIPLVLIDPTRSMTHVGAPPNDEIDGNLIALNALAGIPLSRIIGFRAPYLNYTAETLSHLAATGFSYDSSATASIPVTENGTDAFWPYTLDYGMANDCLNVDGLCKGQPKLPGFWEVPMYAMFDSRGIDGPHLMDPWLCVFDYFQPSLIDVLR